MESQSKLKFHAIAMLIRSEILIDRMFPATTDFVVSAKGTTPPHKYSPKPQIRVFTVEPVAQRKNEPNIAVHPQEAIMPGPRNATRKTTQSVQSMCPHQRPLLAYCTSFKVWWSHVPCTFSYMYTLSEDEKSYGNATF
jgi:hypothetical protein